MLLTNKPHEQQLPLL